MSNCSTGPVTPHTGASGTVVVFCQAPADIKHALALYEKESARSFFHFYVVTVEGMAQFLRSLNLANASVVYLGSPPFSPTLRHLGNNLAVAEWLRTRRKEHFARFSHAQVYYFTNDRDWVTASFVAYLSQRNRVTHISHYPYVCTPVPTNLKARLVMLVFRWLTGARLEWRRIEDADCLSMVAYFRHDLHGIETQPADPDASAVLQKYAYAPDLALENAILYFDAPDEDNAIDRYDERLREIVGALTQSGLTLLVKPHPRLSCSLPFQQAAHLCFLPAFVPGEFLPVRRFKAVLGICSSALGEAGVQRAGQGVWSIIDLFEWRKPAEHRYYKSLVSRYARGQIGFAASLAELAGLGR